MLGLRGDWGENDGLSVEGGVVLGLGLVLGGVRRQLSCMEICNRVLGPGERENIQPRFPRIV